MHPIAKLLITLFIFVVTICALSSCETPSERVNFMEVKFGGDHKLRRLSSNVVKNTSSSSKFFLVYYKKTERSKVEKFVYFSWLDNEGNYITSEVPSTKVRVRLDDSVEEPYVYFGYSNCISCDDGDMEFIFDYNIKYIVVVCKEEDYPVDINIDSI